jgi:HAD superfamily hydrolase (TIGR01662 family)
MSHIRGVIFDLGNTLMFLDEEWEAVRTRGAGDLVEFLKRSAISIDPERFGEDYLETRQLFYEKAVKEAREYSAAYTLQLALKQSGHEDVSEDLIEGALRAFFAFEEERWTAYDEAGDTLQELSQRGYRLALISNATDDPLIQRLVDRFGFRRWFEVTLTSAGVGLRKPHPGIFEKVLSRWGFSPSQVVMIGDTLRFDIAGARNYGMKGVLAAWDLYPDYDAGADHIIPDATADSLPQLVELISHMDDQLRLRPE